VTGSGEEAVVVRRPVFVPVTEDEGFVRRVDFDVSWHRGRAADDKQRNLVALHEAAAAAGLAPLLEVSGNSPLALGRGLSAFDLRIRTAVGEMPVENAFQGAKVFEAGGPFTDLHAVEPWRAKRDPRLRRSGALVRFNHEGVDFPLEPKTVFYDWLYLRALLPRTDVLRTALDGPVPYAGFTDIEFDPDRSVNCQARSCALFVCLTRGHPRTGPRLSRDLPGGDGGRERWSRVRGRLNGSLSPPSL